MKNKLFKLSAPVLLIASVLYLIYSPSKYVGYAPDQPIPFNHKIHSGDNKLDCRYCHAQVDKSAHAGVPPTSTCMNCHTNVAKNKKHIKWITQNYEENKPIQWIKVHNLPDHAYFNHSVHINRGVDCSQCHGNVPEMEKIQQVKSLNMGFCMDCHRDNNAPTDCSTCHR